MERWLTSDRAIDLACCLAMTAFVAWSFYMAGANGGVV